MYEAARILLTFVGMAGMCCLLERVWPQDPTAPRWRSDSLTDVLYFALRVALSVGLAVATAIIGSTLPDRPSSAFSPFPLVVQLAGYLFLSDFVQYWTHWVMHRLTPLWHVHAIHHSPAHVDWLVASRVHPLELGVNKVASAVPLYLAGFSPEIIAVAVPLTACYSLLLHANLSWTYGRLGYVIASPAFHRWHHASDRAARDKNFAQVFSFIDFLFGTAYFPRDRVARRYGIVGGVVPSGIVQQFFYPLHMWRRARARPRPVVPSPGAAAAPAQEANFPPERLEDERDRSLGGNALPQ